MNKIEELSPESFTYELYEQDFGHRLGIYHDYFGEIFQMDDFFHAVKDKIIGWCDPSRLLVRPRTDGAAIMCEDEDGKFWFHIMHESAVRLGIPSVGEYKQRALSPKLSV